MSFDTRQTYLLMWHQGTLSASEGVQRHPLRAHLVTSHPSGQQSTRPWSAALRAGEVLQGEIWGKRKGLSHLFF